MDLEVSDASLFYGVLTDHGSKENWNESQGEDQDPIKVYGMQSNSIELPHPLNYMSFLIKRVGEYYLSTMSIFAREPSVYTDLSQSFTKNLDELSFGFYSSAPNGTGYVLDEKSNTAISIVNGGNSDEIRSLQFGSGGSMARELSDELSFCKDLNFFVSVANTYINSCFDQWDRKNQGVERKNLSIYIHL